jgi:hypothetical protein
MELISTLLILAGLIVTGIGAWVTAQAVIIKDSQQADELSATYWDSNPAFKSNLIAQSRSAKRGLLIIVLGPSCRSSEPP